MHFYLFFHSNEINTGILVLVFLFDDYEYFANIGNYLVKKITFFRYQCDYWIFYFIFSCKLGLALKFSGLKNITCFGSVQLCGDVLWKFLRPGKG